MERSFIRTSLLFVYSSATNETQLAMIDFPKVTKRKTRLTHRDAWTPVRVLSFQRGWPSVVWSPRPNRAAPITQRSCLNPPAG